MNRGVVLCLMLLLSSNVLGGAFQAQLSEADDLRIRDPAKAKAILADIPQEQLSYYEKNLYRYINTVVSTFDSDVNTVVSHYEQLLPDVSNPELRLRVMLSLLNLYGATRNWDKGLLLADSVQEAVDDRSDNDVTNDIYLALTSFYHNLGYSELVLSYSQKIIDSNNASVQTRCGARMLNIATKTEQKLFEQIGYAQFDDAITYCEQNGLEIYVSSITYYLIQYLFAVEKYQEALSVAQTGVTLAEKLQFAPHLYSFYSLYAKVLLENGNEEDAFDYASRVDTWVQDENGEYPDAHIRAYEVLLDVAKRHQDYARAYHYLSLISIEKKSYFDEKVAKELAVQQARYELSSKESEITLLDKENALLKTERELSSKQLQNSLLALSLASLLLAALLFWAYRGRKIQRKLTALARTDSLTELFNRGYFTENGRRILKVAKEQNHPVALILLDLDYFKRINDSFGHQVGDWVLREVSRLLLKTCTTECTVARIGGEEFGVIVNHATCEQAKALAELCRKHIESIDTSASGHQMSLTASFGVSDTASVGYTLDNLFSASDLALYQSKQFGRNKVYEYNGKVT